MVIMIEYSIGDKQQQQQKHRQSKMRNSFIFFGQN